MKVDEVAKLAVIMLHMAAAPIPLNAGKMFAVSHRDGAVTNCWRTQAPAIEFCVKYPADPLSRR